MASEIKPLAQIHAEIELESKIIALETKLEAVARYVRVLDIMIEEDQEKYEKAEAGFTWVDGYIRATQNRYVETARRLKGILEA